MKSLKKAPIRRRKLSDEVVERLLDFIEQEEIRPGDKLPSEHDLMAAFDVGRAAVREALQSLASMGIVSIQHGERAQVSRLTAKSMFGQLDRAARYLLSTSPRTMEDLKQARLLFEIGMVRMAATSATDEQLEFLRNLFHDMKKKAGQGKSFIESDMAFHTAIAEMSGNPIFGALSSAMLQWLSEFHGHMVSVPGAEDVTLSEHKEILECIVKRDPDAAEKAMRDHLTRASELYRARRRQG